MGEGSNGNIATDEGERGNNGIADAELESIKGRLQEFLIANPESEIKRRDDHFVVARPWGDQTFELRVTDSEGGLIEALNSAHLPPRFSALWHRDSKDLEFIWTPLNVDEKLQHRCFDFLFNHCAFRCEFGPASSRLFAIAAAWEPVEPPTATRFRNLDSFSRILHLGENDPKLTIELPGSPASFWIRNVDYEENTLVELAYHLNFYMRYFDQKTPRVLIHEDSAIPVGKPLNIRFPNGQFPDSISARKLDSFMLSMWDSAVEADPYRSFLYNYQILEFAAFYYLREDVVKKLKRVLASPETLGHIDEAVRRIIDTCVKERTRDEDKIQMVINELVEPEFLWRFIEPHSAFFSSDVKFDGGFILPALLRPGYGAEDFAKTWKATFYGAIQNLRNALVHARESRMSNAVTPTRANFERLRPWVAVLGAATTQVMLNLDW